MALLDKLRDIYAQPADRDLLAYFGVAGDQLRWDEKTLTVGDETVTIEAARRAMFGGPVQTSAPASRRSIRIEDL